MNILLVLLLIGFISITGCSPAAVGQTHTITNKVTLATLQACENGLGPCPAISLYRSSDRDSVRLEFPLGGTSSQAWLLKSISDDQPLLSASALIADEAMFLDLTAIKDGKYFVHYLSCGVGGVLALQLSTMPVVCIPDLDTIDGLSVLSMADSMPRFKEGHQDLLQYLLTTLPTPSLKKEDFSKTTFNVSFIIDARGNVRNPCMINAEVPGSTNTLEWSLLQVLREMPPWHPGIHRGKHVPVRIYLPLRINDE